VDTNESEREREREREREPQLWWRVLANAIAFESDAAMREHKAVHGRTHAMAAPLDSAGTAWRVERGDISMAGHHATKCANSPHPPQELSRSRFRCLGWLLPTQTPLWDSPRRQVVRPPP
jgi:hypothetical protein